MGSPKKKDSTIKKNKALDEEPTDKPSKTRTYFNDISKDFLDNPKITIDVKSTLLDKESIVDEESMIDEESIVDEESIMDEESSIEESSIEESEVDEEDLEDEEEDFEKNFDGEEDGESIVEVDEERNISSCVIKDGLVRWNGTHLGEYSHSIIQGTCKINGDRYCKFNIKGEIFYAHIKPVSDNLSCVIDELKVLFSLKKLGTHTIKFHNKLYLLIRANVKYDKGIMTVVEDVPIGRISIGPSDNAYFREEVQKVVAFRELLSISNNAANVIRVRSHERGPYPVSYVESRLDISNHKFTLQIYRKWFCDIDIHDVLPKMVKFHQYGNDLHKLVTQYRWDVEDIINKINKDYVYLSGFIVDQLIKMMS
jgi:hypothetical protein